MAFKKELICAIKNLAVKVKKNLISIDKIDEKIVNNHLHSGELPSVDLLIRTSGEQRISNFLLWQISYAELFFRMCFGQTLMKDISKKQSQIIIIAREGSGRQVIKSKIKFKDAIFNINFFFIYRFFTKVTSQTLPLQKRQKYLIDSIEVIGLKSFNPQTVISYSGLRKGQTIQFLEIKLVPLLINFGI